MADAAVILVAAKKARVGKTGLTKCNIRRGCSLIINNMNKNSIVHALSIILSLALKSLSIINKEVE
ncbi:hypothetical protein P4S72_10800 [Vibrio sp. PP-XX7]